MVLQQGAPAHNAIREQMLTCTSAGISELLDYSGPHTWGTTHGNTILRHCLPPQEAPGRSQETPKRAQEASWRPHEAKKEAPRGPLEAPRGKKRGPKRPPKGPQDCLRESSHDIQTNIQDASNPQPMHGGGMGRTPLVRRPL
eukprot:2868598-Pyramimonas_sp.AAC.1